MLKIRGIPRRKFLLEVGAGALIVPFALLLSGEVAIAKACWYWLLTMTIATAGSVVWAYLRCVGDRLVDRFS